MTIAFDTETALIEPGCLTPHLACVSHAYRNETGELIANLYHWRDARAWFQSTFDIAVSTNRKIVGANVPYDLAVLCAMHPELIQHVFCLYDLNLIGDVQIRERLINIAHGCYKWTVDRGKVRKTEYSLDALTRKYLKHELDKNTRRLRYQELIPFPLGQWPEGAREYATDDAIATLGVWEAQEEHAPLLENESATCRAHWFLHLMSVYGLHTDSVGVEKLRQEIEARHGDLFSVLVTAGLVRENGSRDTKAAKTHMTNVCVKLGIPAMLTDTGQVALDEESCLRTEDPLLEQYAELSSLKKVLSTDLPILESGTWIPVQTRFEPLQETGRTGSSKPNVQNIRRLPGIRECFVPRQGWVYIDADYPMLELHTWAEACTCLVGHSRMAQVLGEGGDPHLQVAADILGATYAEALERRKAHDPEIDNTRNAAKVANFGFPGGLGPETFVEYAATSYKVYLTLDQAKALKEMWLRSWPEARPYFEIVSRVVDEIGSVQQLYSNRYRGGITYTKACNTYFQGLGADIAKHAGYLIAHACYTQEASPLYGSRPVNFVHDQFIVETLDNANAHDAAMAVAQIMHEATLPFLKCVTMRPVEPLLCRRWSKKAKPVFVEGRLVPWDTE